LKPCKQNDLPAQEVYGSWYQKIAALSRATRFSYLNLLAGWRAGGLAG
jgi:hypothetical protein